MQSFTLRRLQAADANSFKELRLEMFHEQPREFRFSPADENDMPLEQISRRLNLDYVIGVFNGSSLAGVGGFSRLVGTKLDHKVLLWGMYVRPQMRGSRAADSIMRSLLEHASTVVEIVTLTVVASNPRAVRFYERWGFVPFGTEPRSIKLASGDYLDEHLMALSLSQPSAQNT